jgi:hypothetical protein
MFNRQKYRASSNRPVSGESPLDSYRLIRKQEYFKSCQAAWSS